MRLLEVFQSLTEFFVLNPNNVQNYHCFEKESWLYEYGAFVFSSYFLLV